MKEFNVLGAGNPRELKPPPAFQFHDGTPEGEAAYFERFAAAYERGKARVQTDDRERLLMDEDDRFDEPLIHDDFQTEEWDAYWRSLGEYYDALREMQGFPAWPEQPTEQVIFEDIDWSQYAIKSTPNITPTPEPYLHSFAADE